MQILYNFQYKGQTLFLVLTLQIISSLLLDEICDHSFLSSSQEISGAVLVLLLQNPVFFIQNKAFFLTRPTFDMKQFYIKNEMSKNYVLNLGHLRVIHDSFFQRSSQKYKFL